MALCGEPEEAAGQRPAVMRMEMHSLRPGHQLRLGEPNSDHINVLALSEGNWPPIVVRRADNTIIDGHYRYRAARRLGHSHIDCVYFDGAEDAAFVEALWRNRHHGLPLSLRERERAAHHLLCLHSDWSDRRIAETCSLAPGTVGRLRSSMPSSSGDDRGKMIRLGRDGKRRPADPQASRDRILRVLEAQPDRSLRAIARIAGASPATVRSVRDRPNPSAARPGTHAEGPLELASRPGTTSLDPRWRGDSALGATAEGKGFATWLEQTYIGEESHDFIEGIPLSRVYEIADEARRRADAWLVFAARLEGKARGCGSGSRRLAGVVDKTAPVSEKPSLPAESDRPYTRYVWWNRL
jgi:ParB-like chromosome segregation protein Spo0J